MTRPSLPIASLALLAAACSGDDAPAGPDAGADPAELALSMGYSLRAGGEAHRCVRVVVPETAPARIGAVSHHAVTGVHHVIVYRDTTVDAAEVVEGEVFDCGEIPGPILYASQELEEAQAMPEGAAMSLAPGEVLRVELHALNGGDAALEARVHVALEPGGPAQVEAGPLFFYQRDILVPAGASASARMRCQVPEDVEIFFAAPHTHARGTRLRAWAEAPGGDTIAILDAEGYADLDTRRFPEPIAVPAGSTIEVECEYENPGAEAVIEGPSADDEMCLLLGGYTPRLGAAFEYCTGAASGPVHDGSLSCGEALGCSQAAGDPVSAEACFVDVCAGSSQALARLTNCGFDRCPAECFDGGADCTGCVARECGEALGACTEAGC